jgi:DtxR family Mn-dependent transcriptional regulator
VVEDYLQVIHYMTRDGVPVIAARLAERLDVTPPTVTATLQRMQRDGLITHGPRKEIRFTDQGRQIAEDIVRRHALAERLLTDLLKMPWHESHEEAHGVEHAMTPKLQARLLQALGNPTTCPHGNPIPGSDYAAPDTVALADLEVGCPFTVSRIPEELEFTPGLLEFLEQSALVPGSTGRVTAASPDGTTTVEIDGNRVGIGAFASTRILVLS